MSSTITVRDIDPGINPGSNTKRVISAFRWKSSSVTLFAKSARRVERRTKPSEAFKRYFGPEHGVELPPPERYAYTPVEFADESKT